MVRKYVQQYQYETQDGTQKKAEYITTQGEGFTAGQKTVIAKHPDGSVDITKQQRVSIKDPNALPQLLPQFVPQLLEDKKT